MTSPVASPSVGLRPRVEHRPAGIADLSLVPLVRELCEMAGLPPDPWQADAHEILFGLREDGNFAAADYAEIVGRQQGKTGGIGVPRILAGLFLLPERLFLWSAHRLDASTAAFETTRDALLTLGDEVKPDLIMIPPLDLPGALAEPLFVQVISANGKEGFRTWTADRRAEWRKQVLVVARSRGGGRGLPVDVRVIDEAFAYTAEQQAALAPTRMARPFGQTLYLSSPPLNGREGAVMYRLRERVAEGDRRLGLRDWGLATTLDEFERWPPERQRAFVYDRANWRATLPALASGRVTEEVVESLISELTSYLDAAREVLCCWPRRASEVGGWAVISEDVWRARGGLEERPEAALAFGVEGTWPDKDSPSKQQLASIAVAGRIDRSGDEESPVLEEMTVQVLEHHAGTHWLVEALRGLLERNPDAVIVIDPRGPLGFLLPDVEDLGYEVVTPTADDLAHGFGRVMAEVDGARPRLRHYDQPELDDAVQVAQVRAVGEARRWSRKGPVSALTAATLALAEAMERNQEPWAM